MNASDRTRATDTAEPAQGALEGALRAWARGRYTTEAGVELLIRHGRFVYPAAPWIRDLGDRFAYVNTEALFNELGVVSGSEKRVAHIALSLISGDPVDLSEALSSLDDHTSRLVAAAVSHATGSHEAPGGAIVAWPA